MDTNGAVKEDMDNDQQWSDSVEQKEHRSRSRSPLDKGSKNRSRDSSVNRNNTSRNRNRSRSPRGKRQRAPTNRRVYVANIPYDCKWTTIKDLFREKVGDVSYVELFEDENGKFRGCGIVELKESSSVQKAVEVLHRFEFRGRQLVVKEDFDVDRDKTGKPIGRSRGSGGGGGGGGNDRDRNDNYNRGGLLGHARSSPQYDTYGLSPQFLESLGITGPLTNRIFVANLDYKVTPQKLEEVFKLAGKVMKIELKRDEDGNSKGHGTIEMGHPIEAVQAISMFNGQKFYNRTMSVRMDKKRKDDLEDKRLPEGLQSVGKGLGANGCPLHLSAFEKKEQHLTSIENLLCAAGAANLVGTGLNQLGGVAGVGATNMGLMQNSPIGPGVSPGAAGIAGLGGIGMGLGIGGAADRNIAGSLGTGMGLGVGNQGLGLGNAAAAAAASGVNPNLLGGYGGTTGMGSSIGTGLGSSLGGGIGSGLSVGANSVGSSGGLGGYGDYDRNYERGDDYSRGSRSSDTIAIRNLPPSCTWQDINDRFREIGDIRFTEMKGRGMAVVRYNSERDARRAVELMRHVRIDGRLLDVSLY